ncbi:MAG: class I SAM-dependent rRNA methyltransferase [Fimbriimonadaceae bacterium]|nr:class I SAM-dependent rRNA methyltransferase [Chitinophagales bacterium]
MHVVLQKGKGRRVEDGHPWVYKNEIESIHGTPETGDIVEVYNFKNDFVGKGYINEQSQITVRLLTRNNKEEINKEFFRKKISECKNYRDKIHYSGNYRLVFGEADFLPALIIDKFNEYYVLQTFSAGMNKWKVVIAEILHEDFHAKGIYERNDVPVRKLEGLEEVKGFLINEFDTNIIIEENGIKFHIDIANGQKTGFFLDQKENRLAIKDIVQGATVLDCFTYTGSFALMAAHFGAKQITALDISEDAIALTKKNISLNNFTNIDCICENAFDMLPQWSKEGVQFDVVILDPPAFTKNRKGIENALKGYKEINLRGMKMVKPGGFLVTFSCSHFVDVNLFYDMIADAAKDANKTIREVQFLSQAKDHPIVWGIEETHYLKGLILQVM